MSIFSAPAKQSDRIGERSLFLRGIYKKDYRKIEDIFRDRLVEEAEKSQTENYDKIPIIFNSVDRWIKQTNLKCWHCCNGIRGVPKFLPRGIEPKNNGQVGLDEPIDVGLGSKYYNVLTEGIFCSFNCAQAYLNDLYQKNMSDYLNRTNMLLFIYSLFNGRTITFIRPSPPKTNMRHFGGPLTVEEYEAEVADLDTITEKECGIESLMEQTV